MLAVLLIVIIFLVILFPVIGIIQEHLHLLVHYFIDIHKTSQEQQLEEGHKPYSAYLVNGVPIWQLEKRGMSKEEHEAYMAEVKRLKKASDGGINDEVKSKAADAAVANQSGDGVMDKESIQTD